MEFIIKLNTIFSKLLLMIFIIVFVSLSITFAVNIFINMQQVKNELNDNSEQIKTRLMLILPEPIWNLQYETLNRILEVEGKDTFISAIIVKDVDGSIIDSQINDNEFANRKSEFNQDFNISYNNEVIATVNTYYNGSKLVETISNELIEQIITGLVLGILILVLFRFAIKKFVINHLEKLKSHLSAFGKNNRLEDDLIINSNDEFSFLAHEFNAMKSKLQNSQNELEEVNSHLEELVKIEVEKNRKKEQQLFEQSKFAQMGEMLGNIAHQWRQPLSAISTLASGTKIQMEYDMINEDMMKQNLDDIVKQTQFLSQTIEDFRNFMKSDKQREEFELTNIVEKTIFIVSSTLKNNNISFSTQFSNENIKVYGYGGELSQVILNILNNAKDILNEKNIEDKQIIIKTSKVDSKAILEIEDNAGGIPDDVLPKIFDPYFTTKHQSVGTGIGLYMSKDIIEKHHHGKISAKNTESGALFTIELNTI